MVDSQWRLMSEPPEFYEAVRSTSTLFAPQKQGDAPAEKSPTGVAQVWNATTVSAATNALADLWSATSALGTTALEAVAPLVKSAATPIVEAVTPLVEAVAPPVAKAAPVAPPVAKAKPVAPPVAKAKPVTPPVAIPALVTPPVTADIKIALKAKPVTASATPPVAPHDEFDDIVGRAHENFDDIVAHEIPDVATVVPRPVQAPQRRPLEQTFKLTDPAPSKAEAPEVSGRWTLLFVAVLWLASVLCGLSPEGKRFVSAGLDETAKLLDAETFELRQTLHVRAAETYGRLAIRAQLLDAETQALRQKLRVNGLETYGRLANRTRSDVDGALRTLSDAVDDARRALSDAAAPWLEERPVEAAAAAAPKPADYHYADEEALARWQRDSRQPASGVSGVQARRAATKAKAAKEAKRLADVAKLEVERVADAATLEAVRLADIVTKEAERLADLADLATAETKRVADAKHAASIETKRLADAATNEAERVANVATLEAKRVADAKHAAWLETKRLADVATNEAANLAGLATLEAERLADVAAREAVRVAATARQARVDEAATGRLLFEPAGNAVDAAGYGLVHRRERLLDVLFRAPLRLMARFLEFFARTKSLLT